MLSLEDFYNEWRSPSDTISIHTSGSTGRPKTMQAEKRRMLASAHATDEFLKLTPECTALLCLPLEYIAGKMMVVRSIECGMQLITVRPSNNPLADIVSGDVPVPERGIDFAAMIPSQVYNSLRVDKEAELLKSIRHLIIGGGAISHGLELALNDFPNDVWSTYGMTETLSHIALRRLSGPDSSLWYTPMPGVKISIVNDDDIVSTCIASCDKKESPDINDSDGCHKHRCGLLVIDAPSVHEGVLFTNDIAEIHPDGHRFRILGRRDNVICSGGIKLHIEEIEEVLRPHLSMPFCITKLTDEKYGEVVVLLIEEKISESIESGIVDSDYGQQLTYAFSHLHRYAVPKKVIRVPLLPMTPNGKIDRRTAETIAKKSK